ncbi:hypothetical protein BO94DRAFT_316200 [Aspergillus sclerotioniger CBS 115572]|uniref:Uncharacterized protein n=1 Tax=Aspergillus sclerotioniger CBS 115572 TaxID=1450535 RepID=A0A317X8N9_9EURO|nr:hypothetical protein BO94DRAFT_316200 [Aspergillus sclerotioniger CBS 115572]PWY93992.1 hypothetical protein BO94DRAFT_316200 [Aspergillus sclerotioniger CBS 115572]
MPRYHRRGSSFSDEGIRESGVGVGVGETRTDTGSTSNDSIEQIAWILLLYFGLAFSVIILLPNGCTVDPSAAGTIGPSHTTTTITITTNTFSMHRVLPPIARG